MEYHYGLRSGDAKDVRETVGQRKEKQHMRLELSHPKRDHRCCKMPAILLLGVTARSGDFPKNRKIPLLQTLAADRQGCRKLAQYIQGGKMQL